MSIKTSGKYFKQWYNDEKEWPKDSYHESETIKINGNEKTDEDSMQDVDDNALIVLSGGYIYFDDGDVDKVISMEGALRRWIKNKDHEESFVRILVEIPKCTNEGFFNHLASIGGKVLA